MNIMLVSVTERTREIGLRMAVGAPGSAILSQLLAVVFQHSSAHSAAYPALKASQLNQIDALRFE